MEGKNPRNSLLYIKILQKSLILLFKFCVVVTANEMVLKILKYIKFLHMKSSILIQWTSHTGYPFLLLMLVAAVSLVLDWCSKTAFSLLYRNCVGLFSTPIVILEGWLHSEAWLPFMTCWICILKTLLSGWSFLFRIYANCGAIAVIASTTYMTVVNTLPSSHLRWRW